jgi:hypothetical protein
MMAVHRGYKIVGTRGNYRQSYARTVHVRCRHADSTCYKRCKWFRKGKPLFNCIHKDKYKDGDINHDEGAGTRPRMSSCAALQ